MDVVSRPEGPLRILVTVGTLDFPFRRLFERLKHITDADSELVIQAGPEAHRLEWPGTVVTESMPPGDLARELERADVVVSHAGIGSSLAAFEAGKLPVLIPRRQAFDEHVDDHQLQVAEYFSDREISLAVDADDLEPRHLELAAAHSVVRADQPAFSLLA